MRRLSLAGGRQETIEESFGHCRRFGDTRQKGRQPLLPGQVPATIGTLAQVGLDTLSHPRRKFLSHKAIQLLPYCLAAHDSFSPQQN
jgi:hypothetical protein